MVMATILQHILFIDTEVICRFVTYSTIIVLFCSLVDTRLLMTEKKSTVLSIESVNINKPVNCNSPTSLQKKTCFRVKMYSLKGSNFKQKLEWYYCQIESFLKEPPLCVLYYCAFNTCTLFSSFHLDFFCILVNINSKLN